MLISTGRGLKKFEPVTVSTDKALLRIVTGGAHYSLSTFKDNERLKANFVQCEAIGLDIDEGMSWDEATETFSAYECLLTTTKSHGIEKNGVVTDRFRVLLKLSKPITDVDTYYATWFALKAMFPAIDPACKDPSRFYYPSPKDALTVTFKGRRFDPVAPSAKAELVLVDDTSQDALVGRLSVATMQFLLLGSPQGSRHTALFKAAVDAREQGLSKDRFIRLVQGMIDNTGNWGTPAVNNSDMQTIDDAWTREVKYGPRVTEKALSFKRIGEFVKEAKQVTWIVDGLLYEGGVSIIAGAPKIGKSTITRQLARSICRGENFLGRKVTKGAVLYLALEEQEGLLAEQFKTVGLKDEDDLFVHVGSPKGNNVLADVEEALEQTKPSILIIDTMLIMLKATDSNNYNEMNTKLEAYRNVARKTGVHILFIHHTNKSIEGGFNTISGSQAIHGAVDCAFVFRASGTSRYISTSQRGGRPFDKVELEFDESTQTYTIGRDPVESKPVRAKIKPAIDTEF